MKQRSHFYGLNLATTPPTGVFIQKQHGRTTTHIRNALAFSPEQSTLNRSVRALRICLDVVRHAGQQVSVAIPQVKV
jgi:hypothetical protein